MDPKQQTGKQPMPNKGQPQQKQPFNKPGQPQQQTNKTGGQGWGGQQNKDR